MSAYKLINNYDIIVDDTLCIPVDSNWLLMCFHQLKKTTTCSASDSNKIIALCHYNWSYSVVDFPFLRIRTIIKTL